MSALHSSTTLSGRGAPRSAGQRPSAATRSRGTSVQVHAFFNFFTPKPAQASGGVDARARPLVQKLIELTDGSDAGSKSTPAEKEEIAELVGPWQASDAVHEPWEAYKSSSPPVPVSGLVRCPLPFLGEGW
jgi:hypothetical protein